MAGINQNQSGMFCWADLGTRDTKTAKRFYGDLFGWEFNDLPMGEQGSYTIAKKKNRDVVGLYPLPTGVGRTQGPSRWATYFSVTDVDSVAKRATSLGGKVVEAPSDVMEAGRMAVIQDPTGAVANLWQARKHAGAEAFNEHGALTWAELATHNPERAGVFYSELLGWTQEQETIDRTQYTTFRRAGKPVAGMMATPRDWGTAPPRWGIYFAVDNCDAAAKKAHELGAKVIVQARDIGDVGRLSALEDPLGAAFSIIKLNPRAVVP